MRRTKKEADETRRQILETATDMFIENGFSNTSLTDISHKIGMTKGAVYWHFKNKDDVLLQIVKKNCSLIIQDAVNSLVDPRSSRSTKRCSNVRPRISVMQNSTA